MRLGWLIIAGLVGCSEPEVLAWEPGDPWTWTDAPAPEVLASGFIKPMGVAVVGDQIWVVDEGNHSVSLLTDIGETVLSVGGFTSPRWIATSESHVVVTESHDAGQVIALNNAGEVVLTLHPQVGSWGPVSYGGDRFWWFETEGSTLYSWAVGEAAATATTMSGPIQSLTGSSSGVTVAMGTKKPWHLVDGSGAEMGQVWDAPQDLAWSGETLWITTRSARWPYGGWVYRLAGSDIAQVAVYSPPEPGPIAVTESAIFWGSKQTLTRYATGDATYSAVGLQTAVADVVARGEQVYWTDRQRGVLLTWMD